MTLLLQYTGSILKHKEALTKLSKYILVDAYFSKEPFISAICKEQFEIIFRLRKDAHLQYQFTGEQNKRKPK